MDWKDVGEWLKNNAGAGAALVGSLLTGNVPGAIAAGVSMVSAATGHATPQEALNAFQNDPQTVVKLKDLANAENASIRQHLENMTRLELEDGQKEHEQTQLTIRSGDNSADPFVRRTRPAQSWVSLIAALVYVFAFPKPDLYVLGALLTLPCAYAGLRQIGKGIDSVSSALTARAAK